MTSLSNIYIGVLGACIDGTDFLLGTKSFIDLGESNRGMDKLIHS